MTLLILLVVLPATGSPSWLPGNSTLTLEEGYLEAVIVLPQCPVNVTLILNGVEMPAPYKAVEEEGSCRVVIDTRGLSPYRLGPGDSVRIVLRWPGGSGWLEARVAEEGPGEAGPGTPEGEGFYTLPPPSGVQGNGVADNTLGRGVGGYLWLAASLALAAASILVGVREYGRG